MQMFNYLNEHYKFNLKNNKYIIRSAIARGNKGILEYLINNGVTIYRDDVICAIHEANFELIKLLYEKSNEQFFKISCNCIIGTRNCNFHLCKKWNHR